MKRRARAWGRVLPTLFVGGVALNCGGSTPDAGGEASARAAGEAPTAAADGPVWSEGPRLPMPIGNNGVAAMAGPSGVTVMSFLGIDSTKFWSGVTREAFRWDFGASDGWRRIEPVPGPPRLAPTVEVLGGRVFVFGGYTVAQDGSEQSRPEVAVYSPVADAWGRAADIPTPVDDAVSGVWSRTSIYLVSGWHDGGNVRDVQVFDPTIDRWSAATPIPGAPVFGHSGSIAGNEIVYVGGARVVEANPRFVIDSAAWVGSIDPADPLSISWRPVERPPGPPLYRAAAGAAEGVVLLLGGSDNPYNYNGIGYDGAPSEPVGQLVAYDGQGGWSRLTPPPVPTMDHRNLAIAGGYVFVVGGMTAGQQVSDRVFYARLDRLLEASD